MPSSAEIRDTVRRYAKLLCDSDADAIAELYAEDCRVEDPVGGEPIHGRAAVRSFYAAAAPRLQVEIVGPICVSGSQCAVPLLAELTMNDRKSYMDVIDEFSFDGAGRITSMRAFWNPAELRPTR
jgi:steroid Delta-isomerase